MWLSVLQISNVVERQLANMFPWMEYVVRVGWLPDGNRLVSLVTWLLLVFV